MRVDPPGSARAAGETTQIGSIADTSSSGPSSPGRSSVDRVLRWVAGIAAAVISGLILFWLTNDEPTPPAASPEAVIVEPSGRADWQSEVTGTASGLGDDNVLYVVVVPADPDRYYPQDPPATVRQDGTWTADAVLGEPDDIGDEFQILAVAVSDTAADEIRAYLTAAAAAGTYPGLDRLPDDATVLDTATVIRS